MKAWRGSKYSASIKSVVNWLAIIIVIALVTWLSFYSYLQRLVAESKDNETSFEIHTFFISLLFAVIGVIFSIRALADSAEQEKKIEVQRKGLAKTAEHLEDISKQMSTRHIDSFPDHLDDIIKLIAETRKTFYIVVDCADYGSFSNPKGQKKMVQAIQEICKNNSASDDEPLTIELRICGDFQLISRSSEFWEQWQAAQTSTLAWEVLLIDKKFQGRLDKFCEHNTELQLDKNHCSIDDFKNIMLKKHEAVKIELKNCGDKVKVVDLPELRNDMPGIFFWMRDEKEAVFLFSHTGAGAQGMAFFTRDANIIGILKNTWKHVTPKNDGLPAIC